MQNVTMYRQGSLLKLATTTVAALFLATSAQAQTVVFDDFEHGDPINVGWFAFGSAIGGGGIDPNGADLAPIPDNMVGMQVGWGGGEPGFWGGFGWENPIDISGTDTFSFWINPDAGADYVLEINIQDDDNGDGFISSPEDDEFQYSCIISSTGPCVIAGGGWQKVNIPLTSFFDDNSFLTGGDGVLNATSVANGGNGELIVMVAALISNDNNVITLRTDQWQFENTAVADTDEDGIGDDVDNCTLRPNANQRDTNGDGYGNACDPDTDNNGFVNFGDVSSWIPFFNQECASTPEREDRDFNGDGFCNFGDYGLFPQFFNQPPGPSALAP